MYNKIVAGIVALSITVSYLGAMEPWMAASASTEQPMEMRAVVVKQTPAQTLKAKQNELTKVNTQLNTASGTTRSDLMTRKKQLEKDITALQK